LNINMLLPKKLLCIRLSILDEIGKIKICRHY
jgi:hypothetical protein